MSHISIFSSRATRRRVAASVGARALAAITAAGGLLGAPSPGSAQTVLPGGRQASRADLAIAAVEAEQTASATRDGAVRARKRAEASAMRERLRVGDFRPGDRLYVMVESDTAMTDTVVVRADQKIQLPRLPELSLAGVLTSELDAHLAAQLSRYLQHPVVRASALVRLAVLGAVAKPGYYSVPADALLSDALMVAGGPSATADVQRTTVRRDGRVVIDRPGVERALSDGRTIADLGVRPGDEIRVDERAGNVLQTVWTQVGAVSGLAFTALWLLRR